MKTDSLFYRLFQADPGLALELAGLTVPEPERYRFVSVEVKQTAFRLDGVLLPPADRPDASVIFVEAQAQPDDGFYLRFVGEMLVYLRQYSPVPVWRAVVFYPDEATERVDGGTEPFLHLPNLHRVYLSRLALLDSPNPKLWLIALVLAKEPQIQAIVERIQTHRRQHPDDGIDWLDLLETILVYKLPKFSREEIQAMFNFNETELKQTKFYQQVFGEGEATGEARGEAKGEARGKIKGEADMFALLLEHRFGPLSPKTRQRIVAADDATLRLWAKRLLDANSLDEVWGH
ncbi:Rpn family recombination-promoting nuclease/putative transposase [Methylomagnum sp.]